jgi:hypothetical protein
MVTPKWDANSPEIAPLSERARRNDFVHPEATVHPRYEEVHRRRHKELHSALEELLGDYLLHHDRNRPETIKQLMDWSASQTICPTPVGA